ncbi:MAG: siroheme synthase CysG, partial [Pseudomonadota bacterium]
PDDIEAAALVVGDVEDAAAFYAASMAVGVPVNVIDRPDFCSFQFGSIVNRSPVVVGISTTGAAPILGQAIRQKIEAMLPRSMGDWAAAAKRSRAWLAERVPDAKQRREIWQRFSGAAFKQAAPASPDAAFKALVNTAPTEHCGTSGGKVTLVGAGPGDAELLTIKAVRALQSADVILFDDLISDDVLELARREAKRMLVGKRGGRVSCRQSDINDLMLKLARQGKHVVRLKSGDAMIFGRAGEEIAALDAAGICVDVVPGVTSALAAAASAKVSLTHRDHAQSVRFITGHSRKGELPQNFDWPGLADANTTLMIYMGGNTIRSFCERLMEYGYDPATPAAVFEDVSRPGQTTQRASVGALARGAWQKDQRPVLIGIGNALEGVAAEALPARKQQQSTA